MGGGEDQGSFLRIEEDVRSNTIKGEVQYRVDWDKGKEKFKTREQVVTELKRQTIVVVE
ncbi:hypothetical protein HPP92_023923 [Vanilla planifolia]|uniref:Uncharacterized protein n=1 Tax=Vanilla planifolia TaxID=51239 RepID=A0A835PPC3_VANPL|nr:hypothetical protein HPP92_023923 [Vanilla planifolia]